MFQTIIGPVLADPRRPPLAVTTVRTLGATAARGCSACFSLRGTAFTTDVSGSITGIRFYKPGANTGSHIGTLWSASGQQLATANSRTRLRRAGRRCSSRRLSPSAPVRPTSPPITRQQALLGHRRSVRLSDQQPAAPRAGRQHDPQRRLRLRLRQQIPQQHLQRDELLCRRPVCAASPAGPGLVGDGDGRTGVGSRQLVCADHRWPAELLLHHAVHRVSGPAPNHRVRQPTGDHGHDQQPDAWYRLHVHGDRQERQRHRARVASFELSDSDRSHCSVRANRRRRYAGKQQAAGYMDRTR